MLTDAQKQTLKTYILADPVLAAMSSGPGTDYNSISIALNSPSNPAVQAWRVNVDPRDIDEATPWTAFDGITQAGKRDSFVHAFLRYPRDFTKQKTRKWVTDVWGNASAGSNAESIFLGCAVETATRAEAALGGASENINNVTALDRAWIGTVTIEDVAGILR